METRQMQTTTLSRVLATAAASAALVACGGGSDRPAPAPQNPPPVVQDGPMVRKTTAGKIEGVDDSAATGTYAWKGVPFAQPPVGNLRWAPPAEPAAWDGVRAT